MCPSLAAERALAYGPVVVSDRYWAYEKAREAWSSFGLSFAQFSVHLDRLGYTESVPSQVASVYLCAACSLGIDAACRALDQTYFPTLRAAIARRDQGSDFVEEVLQQLRERLFVGPSPRIASYRGEGSLSGWLRRVANHLAIDRRRSDSTRRRALRAEWQRQYDEPSAQPPEQQVRHETWASCLERALHDALGSLAAVDRQLLYTHYVELLSAEEIGRAFNMDRSTVYRRIDRSERQLKRRIRAAIQARLGISNREEFDSLMRAGYAEVSLGPSLWSAA